MHGRRLVAAALAIAASAGAVLAAASAAPSAEDLRRIALENDILAHEVALATGKDFYLILDSKGARLTLYLQAAELRHYEVLALEVADPRVAFVSRGESRTWQNRIWSGGALDPPRAEDRVEIKVPPPGSEASTQTAPIPLTPEEAHPVPPRYGIRYQGGLFVEVRAKGDGEEGATMGARLGAWWRNFKEAVRSEPTDVVRLRLTLQAEDAKAIYRSLPPGTRLLILPPR